MNAEEIHQQIYQMGEAARKAALKLAVLSVSQKNEILMAMAESLRNSAELIVTENAKDIQAGEEKGLSIALLDRLRLDTSRINDIATSVEKVAKLNDPVGEELAKWQHPQGMEIQQVRVPIGVIGIIYESRPNVTSDAAVLCLKSGNATILRGGSEAIYSNRAIADALQSGGEKAGLPQGAIQLIPFTDRESVKVMAGMEKWLDLIIPRGGKGLIETVVSLARMPVIKHYDGICHVYVDTQANLPMAVEITNNSKTHKPSVCNALETLLIHREVAKELLPKLVTKLDENKVEIRGDQSVIDIIGERATLAEEADWETEYLDYILAVKIVDSMDEAIEHINKYGSGHSDCIVTDSDSNAHQFLTQIDSACVYHNVSTRFSDGEEFGFGAEIGISTDKLHARGPMALKELTSYQYRIRGNGEIR